MDGMLNAVPPLHMKRTVLLTRKNKVRTHVDPGPFK
jgi:hypothetical protein